MDTTLITCEWKDNNGLECQAQSRPHKAYCDEHYPLVYQVGTALRKRKKDIRVADRIREIESTLHEAYLELEEG